jgi:hypothetical protein
VWYDAASACFAALVGYHSWHQPWLLILAALAQLALHLLTQVPAAHVDLTSRLSFLASAVLLLVAALAQLALRLLPQLLAEAACFTVPYEAGVGSLGR